MQSHHQRPNTAPRGLTGEPLLLHTGVLHRVDCRQMPADAGVSFGALCTQKTAGHTPTEKRMPELEAEAVADYHAERALFWRCYIGLVVVVLAGLGKWLTT